MGFFRGGFLILFGTLLFLSLFMMNSFFALSSSLEYDNIKNELPLLIEEITEGSSGIGGALDVLDGFNLSEASEGVFEIVEEHCLNNSDYVFSYEGYVVDIPCSVIEGGADAVIDETVNDLIEKIYYEDYDCGFWDCLSKTGAPFFLVSEKAKDYWKGKLYLALVISLALAVLLFFLTEEKQNFPIVLGSIIIVSALPLAKFKSIFSIIGPPVSLFVDLFFSRMGVIFWFMFIAGLVILGLGIALKLSKTHFLKTKFSRKDVKKIVSKTNK
ncbi:MAG TPA: hypothetical protein ENH99_01185 [Candidatus Pacearchaeota archaeon]|nr:hypothetical protein [Candidatus Pacearchaeota archaeon]